MDVIYRLGEGAVAEVREQLPDPPSYSTVRALLRVLEEKGHVSHRQDGPRYVYRAITPRDEASSSALERLLSTFFEGSPHKAMAALLDLSDDLGPEELDRMERMIQEARRQGR